MEMTKQKVYCILKGECMAKKHTINCEETSCKLCKYNINIKPILKGECAG